ncbi:MAG TPA: family 1 glycosylhydrolase [Fimbriimonadaceae bacterium]|jgi:beta-glucosidase/6-phospho-beta-glucosidase/beta-galactosidase
MSQFMFCTGIENSYPIITGPDGKPFRVDEMAKCCHYKHWRQDFELVKEMGLRFLRYGPPIYKTWLGPGHYDWSFADETFNHLRHLNITPIADLCHFGVPDWIGNFQNPELPELFAEYAQAFAKRYNWIKFFTPVNEIFIAATFSALYGWWNEQLCTDQAFVTALKHLCKANTMAMHAILKEQPHAIFIQSESSEYFHATHPDVLYKANVLNERRFLSLDLTYGKPVNVTMYRYLLANGMTSDEYDWFRDNHVKTRCVMGNDYYVTNEHLVQEDGSWTPAGEIFGYYVITHQYFERYRLPVMHTETNYNDAEKAPDWLRKEWANLFRLREDGVPIIGFTWYSLTDQVDWDSALRSEAGSVNPLGLYDLDRNIRPVGTLYKEIIKNWRDILPTGSHSLTVLDEA